MPSAPETISHYKLISPLGRGGMGEVYRALDQRLKREVAIKLLAAGFQGNSELHERFLREARAASALNHPGIVTLHDVGEHEGRLFLVMELVAGERFTELVAQRLPPAEALRLCAEAADALAVAHAQGILHRDVKSDNLMRTKDGRVKVLDFGLAKLETRSRDSAEDLASPSASQISAPHQRALPVSSDPTLPAASGNELGATLPTFPNATRTTRSEPLGAPTSNALTSAGALIGTPAYMAPEQAAGEPCDARSEVFSLGVVLYELLVGKRPFDRASTEQTLHAVRAAEVEPPSRTSGVPSAVDDVVLSALVGDRQHRIPDMATFAKRMREAATAFVPKPKTLRRPVMVAIGVASAAVVAILATIAFGGRDRPPPTADRAPPSTTVTSLRQLAKTIVRIDDTHVKVPRSTVDKLLADPTVIFDGARVVPTLSSTGKNGYKLYGLGLLSVWAWVGFMDGDMLHAVNGVSLDTPDEGVAREGQGKARALELYAKFRKADKLEVEITRQGEPLVLSIEITD